MRFRIKIFLPFLIISLLLLMMAQINPPVIYIDQGFIQGKELQAEIGILKNELMEEGLTKEFSKIDAKIIKIIDDGRERHQGYGRLAWNTLALVLLLLGFIISILSSWHKDVITIKNQTGKMPNNTQ